MLPTLSSQLQYFDARTYAICKPFLARKDRRSGTQIGTAILQRIASGKRVRLLDIGTGEGVILREALDNVLDKCDYASSKLTVTCLEPESFYRDSIERLVEDYGSIGMNMSFAPESLEQYLEREHQDCFDIVTATHAMYHFERSSWSEIVAGVQSVLRRDGVLLVQLVSRESALQKLGKMVTVEAERSGVERTFSVSGYDVCIEDFVGDLLSRGFKVNTAVTPSSALAIEPLDYWAAIQALDNCSLPSPPLLELIGFMLRIPVDSLRLHLKRETKSLIQALDQEHPPLTMDGVVALGGGTR